MNTARFTTIVVILALGGIVLAGGRADLKALQGSWSATITETDGQPAPPEVAKLKLIVIVKDDTFRVLAGEQVISAGKLKLDAGKKPATMDATNTEGPLKDMVQKAIYKISGDKMTAVWAKPGKERPTEFKSAEGSGQSIIQYERLRQQQP